MSGVRVLGVDACKTGWVGIVLDRDAARTARRVTRGRTRSFPDPPEVFSDGLAYAIWA